MKYIDGDIFELARNGQFDVVIHGCNCQNAMGSGIAATVRDKYYQAYAADKATQAGDWRKLGCFTKAHIPSSLMTHPPLADGTVLKGLKLSHGFEIINAYTQFYIGSTPDDKPPIDYDAVERVFMSIKLAYDNNPAGVTRFAIPKIGAVRGGGDWSRIEAIIDSIGFIDLTCVLYNGTVNK